MLLKLSPSPPGHATPVWFIGIKVAHAAVSVTIALTPQKSWIHTARNTRWSVQFVTRSFWWVITSMRLVELCRHIIENIFISNVQSNCWSMCCTVLTVYFQTIQAGSGTLPNCYQDANLLIWGASSATPEVNFLIYFYSNKLFFERYGGVVVSTLGKRSWVQIPDQADNCLLSHCRSY